MGRMLSGKLVAGETRFALVASRFNEFIVSRLIEGARDELARHGAADEAVDVIWVPGALELAMVAQRVARTKQYGAVLCLGAVIRGGTPHFDYVAGQTARGIAQVALQAEVPVVFGVLTTDTIEQAVERAGTKAGNKGADAARAAMELVNLYQQI